MKKGSFLPLTVGVIGVLILLLNLLTSSSDSVGRFALGLILFSITLALLGRND